MIIAANLKTNLTRVQTTKYINELESFINANNINQEIHKEEGALAMTA